MGPYVSPVRARRRTIVLLRGGLVVAVGGLLIQAQPRPGWPSVLLVAAFALSDLALPFLPPRITSRLVFERVVGAVDLLLVGAGILFAGAGGGALPVSCLFMALVCALGTERSRTAAGATAVGALHAWLVLRLGVEDGVGWQLLLQTLLLCTFGLYFAFLAEGAHAIHRKRQSEKLERRELTALLEVFDTVNSSLDLPEVALSLVTRLAALVPAVRCSLLCVDAAGERGWVLASHDNPDLEMLEVDLRKYPEVRAALRSRNPVVIRDVFRDPILAGVRGSFRRLDFRSVVVVPLESGGEVLGALCLKTAQGDGDVSPWDVRFCTAVAGASAQALRNALLHRQVLDEARRAREAGDKLAAILDHAPELLLTVDASGRISEANRGAEEMLGRSRAELAGLPCTEVLADPASRARLDPPARACVALRRADGRPVEAEIHTGALGDGAVWAARDVTELRAAQFKLQQADKLTTLGQFVAGVAHELNNPLGAVLGFAQRLAPSREARRIQESAERCRRIVGNLMAFARAHRPERRAVRIDDVLDQALALRAEGLRSAGIEVVREGPPGLPPVWADPHQLQSVFVQLISNAVQALEQVERRRRLVLRASRVGSAVRVEVEDDGPGMPPSVLARIFDPFFTTRAPGQGTGLGLSAAYGILQEHGGRIEAVSEPGRGSVFAVELPVAPAEDREAPAPADPATCPAGRILVVDDEPFLVELLTEVLTEMGHRVDGAANGREAWDRVREAGGYDLVITDIRMPEMNGIELYRALETQRPDMADKVLFVTGDLVDPETVGFLNTTRARALFKPMDLDEVRRVVTELLG